MSQSQTSGPTVNASGTLLLSDHLQSRGYCDQNRLEQLLGMPLTTLQDPDCRVPVTRYHALWQEALETTGDAALGLRLGEVVDPDRMGLMSHIFFNSDTVAHAMDEYVRLQGLVNEAVQLIRVHEGDQVRLVWQVPDPTHYCIADMERTLSAALTRARHFIHPDLAITQLTLAHESPLHVAHYHRIFRCPMVFAAGEVSVAFPARYLDGPLPRRNPHVHSALLGHVNRLVRQLRPQQSTAQRVRRAIARQLPRTPDADRVAAALNMSRQTLYRKLKKEGEGFQHLAESVRQQRGLRLVAEGRYALSEIAFLLGFSELSAFSRAFKRWTGESPAHYRRNHEQPPGD
ncbi:MAG: AraC family transcriptional regulator [Halomonadaceae bacterium]|nr:MAG: AraC family transcriptional regulator [Halomonadaceae bacterium]